MDSDSSKFSWVDGEEKKRNPDFPKNYIEHILKNIDTADIILVSTHDEVRKELEDNDIKYTLVYPDISLKDEYVERYKERGNDTSFINFIESNWNDMIAILEKESYPTHIKLKSGEFLSDVIPR